MVVLAAVAVVRLLVDRGRRARPRPTPCATSPTSPVEVDRGARRASAALELLCDVPIELYRMTVESTITRWQALAGEPAPDVTARVSDVDDGSVRARSSSGSAARPTRSRGRAAAPSGSSSSTTTAARASPASAAAKARRPTTLFAADGYYRRHLPAARAAREPA